MPVSLPTIVSFSLKFVSFLFSASRSCIFFFFFHRYYQREASTGFAKRLVSANIFLDGFISLTASTTTAGSDLQSRINTASSQGVTPDALINATSVTVTKTVTTTTVTALQHANHVLQENRLGQPYRLLQSSPSTSVANSSNASFATSTTFTNVFGVYAMKSGVDALSWFELVNSFSFDLNLFTILFLAMGVPFVLIALMFWALQRVSTRLSNPRFNFWELFFITKLPAFLGTIYATVPFVVLCAIMHLQVRLRFFCSVFFY